nr:MAG TPA: hypothetical protein [Bacteriophage sp.]
MSESAPDASGRGIASLWMHSQTGKKPVKGDRQRLHTAITWMIQSVGQAADFDSQGNHSELRLDRVEHKHFRT